MYDFLFFEPELVGVFRVSCTLSRSWKTTDFFVERWRELEPVSELSADWVRSRSCLPALVVEGFEIRPAEDLGVKNLLKRFGVTGGAFFGFLETL
jgi:hypothetical protein